MADNEQLTKWLKNVAKGNQAAFKSLYEETSSQLYAVCLRMLVRPSLAEEVLQEVYLRIWDRAAHYQSSQAQVMTWMSSIARNRCVDVLRSLGSRQEDMMVDLDDYSGILSGGSEMPIGQTMDLERCMEELSGDHKNSISLAFFAGMTHGEVADVMNRPLGTVKAWVRRGMQQLRECLQ